MIYDLAPSYLSNVIPCYSIQLLDQKHSQWLLVPLPDKPYHAIFHQAQIKIHFLRELLPTHQAKSSLQVLSVRTSCSFLAECFHNIASYMFIYGFISLSRQSIPVCGAHVSFVQYCFPKLSHFPNLASSKTTSQQPLNKYLQN